VDASESQTSIEVKIVSDFDPTKTATKAITVNSPSPPTELNFKEVVNANLLGLYPGADYANGGAVISAMDLRINSTFYDASSGIDVDPSDVFGVTGIKINDVASTSPGMAWFIYNDSLAVYGQAGNATIVFNIAVINETTGLGWITGDYNNSPYGYTYLRTYSTGVETISISNLTDGNITTVSGLNDYKMYVIVRNTGGLHDGAYEYDFNINAYKTQNVISVTVP
jgi:hypothetical protein